MSHHEICPFDEANAAQGRAYSDDCQCDLIAAVRERTLDEAVAACKGARVQGDDGAWNVAVGVCVEYVDALREATP